MPTVTFSFEIGRIFAYYCIFHLSTSVGTSELVRAGTENCCQQHERYCTACVAMMRGNKKQQPPHTASLKQRIHTEKKDIATQRERKNVSE
jgi:hypothetical protein